jgi:chromosome segregation ATPase
MTIDTNALRKFQEIFAPILELIPAVLAAEAGKRDLDREIVLKKAELDKADKDITRAFEEANKRLSAINSEMEKLMQQKTKVLSDIEAAKNVDADNRANIEKDQAKSLNDWSQKVAKLQSQYSNVEAEHAKNVAVAEAAFAEKSAALEADVKDLEKRKATAEKALEALRNKLG